jgi:hypothetical protein
MRLTTCQDSCQDMVGASSNLTMDVGKTCSLDRSRDNSSKPCKVRTMLQSNIHEAVSLCIHRFAFTWQIRDQYPSHRMESHEQQNRKMWVSTMVGCTSPQTAFSSKKISRQSAGKSEGRPPSKSEDIESRIDPSIIALRRLFTSRNHGRNSGGRGDNMAVFTS